MRYGCKHLGFVLLVFLCLSCGKKILPAGVDPKEFKEFDQASFNYIYAEAIKQKILGNGGESLKYLEQCVKINPESDASYFQMAQIVLANGDINSGKKFANKALSIDGQNIWYLMMLAGIYYQEENLDSAIFCYEKALSFYPGKESIKLTLGKLYSEKKEYAKAETIFEELDKKYGINENTSLASIQNLLEAGKYDQALAKAELLLNQNPDEILYNGLLAEIYRAKGDTDRAMDVYNKLIERNPGDPQIQLSLCDFLITEKRYDELFLLLNRVVINSSVIREDKISLLARILEIPEVVSAYDEKLNMTLMILEADNKEDNIVPLLRVELMIKKELYSTAIERLEELIKSQPDNYFTWEKLLLVYMQIKDYKNLYIKGGECATKFNRSFVAKVLYANGAIENEKYAIALEELRKAEILAGDNKDYILQVVTMRADVYYRMKDYSKAFEIFNEAIKLNKDDLTLLNNYAYYLAEQNMNLKEAEIMIKKVIEIEKDNTTYLDTYAWVLYKRGKINEAAKIMESVINSDNKPDAEWYEHYGYILRKKNCIKATELWNTALKLDSKKTHLIKEIEGCKK